MSLRDQLTADALEVIVGAKVEAASSHANEVDVAHFVAALLATQRSLVTDTLKAAGLAAYRLPTQQVRDPAELPPMTLSKPLERIIAKALQLAAECPLDPAGRIAPLHLWVSFCRTPVALRDLLGTDGVSPSEAEQLTKAACGLLTARKPSGQTPFKPEQQDQLDQFCRRNLTQLARDQQLSPAYGAEQTREQIINTLLRRKGRSVVLTGLAGVGKTKLVEDLALAIAEGQIPELASCQVFELDLAKFTQGTHLAGSRATRWNQLSEILSTLGQQLILFIDELHTIMGLSIEGQTMDLSNALKPLLVDGSVRIIGATTIDEYQRHIAEDPALSRRFAEVRVPEPDKDSMLSILQHVAGEYEAFHSVSYSLESLESIYDLAQLYFPNQAFPAKGVNLLDDVGVLVKRQHTNADPAARPPVVSAAEVRTTLKRSWGIEPATQSADLAELICERVIGQDHAARQLSDAIITSGMGYGRADSNKPRAILMFMGAPGVGKSYMAEVLADLLFPGRHNLLTVDMAEFGGDHNGELARHRLLGPPPPYVGWENGGLLTSHVLRNPTSVILLDELDKAGGDARSILLKVFNDGWVADGRGRTVSFRGVYFIITANAGRDLWDTGRIPMGFAPSAPIPESGANASEREVHDALLQEHFDSALLSRISRTVMFNTLTDSDLEQIVKLRLKSLHESALCEDRVLISYDEDSLARWLVAQTPKPGDTRRLKATLERLVETSIARWRWQQAPQSGARILRLEPNGDQITLTTEYGEQAERAFLREVATRFTGSEERERQLRTISARLG